MLASLFNIYTMMKPLYSRGGVAVQSQMWNSMSQSQHFSSFMMQQPACYLAVGIETMILLLGKKPQWHFLTTWSIQLGVLVKTSRKKFLRAEEQWNNFALGMLKTFVDFVVAKVLMSILTRPVLIRESNHPQKCFPPLFLIEKFLVVAWNGAPEGNLW